MKKIAFITLSLLLAVSFWNCEKDDICAEGTPVTPRVIIEFFDATNPTTPKNVTNLGVIATGFTEGFAFNGTNKIEVPLRTNVDTTELDFVLNGADNDPANDETVTLTFNYERSNVFISRACGYKTIFNLTNVLPTDFTGTWISSLTIEQPNIINENETHIKIYF
jgi:hypothetical protein